MQLCNRRALAKLISVVHGIGIMLSMELGTGEVLEFVCTDIDFELGGMAPLFKPQASCHACAGHQAPATRRQPLVQGGLMNGLLAYRTSLYEHTEICAVPVHDPPLYT